MDFPLENAVRDGWENQLSASVARGVYADFRKNAYGWKPGRLLTDPASNYKLAKTGEYSLALYPARHGGCPWSGPCIKPCIGHSAGRARFASTKAGRKCRSDFLFYAPRAFMGVLVAELGKLPEGARVRLNCYSDIRWERAAPDLFRRFRHLKFYDYTKAELHERPSLPRNLRLTHSLRDTTLAAAEIAVVALRAGRTAAVVFAVRKDEPLPKTWFGYRVIDGDKSDNRWSQPRGTIAGLRAKGAGRGPAGDGFVVKP